jgi:hypothetical protein
MSAEAHEEEIKLLGQQTFRGPTAAYAYAQQSLGGIHQPDRSSERRNVFYLPSRQQWASVEVQNGLYLVGVWNACPCALG